MGYRYDMRGYIPQQQAIVQQRDKEHKILREENEKQKKDNAMKTALKEPVIKVEDD